ncbi:O-antigen ligase family protein [Actinomycetospora termitidis]|uniref:O-antigen ligase family protein n=1 Tax=Actinomycetospora termitidis TaxID=3053470 RepID=A0ABT7MFS4_9PSEU|nr:O-antigen ligase family protein [Actinomycetospora sp. Odt1-22]MDL5158999.1 O-antigen ligase family protein [Actinomycetospora sp. Odt1-22]
MLLLRRADRVRSALPLRDRAVGLGAAVAVAVAGVLAPHTAGPVLLLAGLGGAVVILALVEPAAALLLLMTTAFLRSAIHEQALDVPLPGLLLLVAVAGLLVAVLRGRLAFPRLGAPEIAMGLYLAVNVASWLSPHALAALNPRGGPQSVPVLIVTGIAFPFTAYLLGRAGGGDPRVVSAFSWWVVAATAYSALIAVMQFHGLSAFVLPRSVVESPSWPDRAVGVFDQPVTNGVLFVVGLLLCLRLGGEASRPRRERWIAHVVAVGAVYGIYLTHTRAVWLVTGLALLAAPLVSHAYRRGAAVILAVAVAGIVANWAAFTGTDRAAGGVGTTSEIDDRLNIIATAVRAVGSEPLLGWGIGRFPQVNTLYHEQWSTAVDWRRGFGIASHETELAVVVELGVLGLLLWIAVLVLILRRVLAARRGPTRATADTALLAVLVVIVVGFTVDIRFLDFAWTLAFLLAGLAVGPGRPRPEPIAPRLERIRIGAPR